MKLKTGLLFLFVSVLLFAYATTAGAVEKVIGYCPDEISSDVKPVGVSGQQVYLSAAVKFPASAMQSMKGNQITKIRIGIGEGMKNVYAWIRVGELSSTPVVLQKVDSPVEGWNEVTLATPYDIDGSDIYVGYSGRQPSNNLCIWLDGDDNENAMFINDGSTWDNYYGQGWGSLLIQATVSGDNFATADMAIESISLDSTYYKSGSVANMDFTIVNQGQTDFATYGYGYQIDSQESVTETVAETLPSSGKVKVSKTLDLSGVSEGVHTVRVFLTQPDASADTLQKNDTLTRELLVYTNQYKKNLLLEQFTTIACVNCPYGDAVLNYAMQGRDNVAWVAHHVGYGTDELTVSPSSQYMNFGVSGAPMAMVDRAYVPVEQSQSAPAFSIGYTTASYGGQIVGALMDYLSAQPAFVKLDAQCNYDETSRELTVTVNGERNGILKALQPDLRLSIFLTEDNVTAKVVQTGTKDDYTHHHVLRSVLTDTFGSEVEWDGDKFVFTETETLKDSWKTADMKVVAFVSKPYSSSNVNNADVLNTTIMSLGNLSGIATVGAEQAGVTIEGGRLVVEGGCDAVEVFSANGAKVDADNLSRGLYIVKVRKGSNITKAKLIY